MKRQIKRTPLSPAILPTATQKQLQNVIEAFQASLSPDQRKKQEDIQKKYASRMQTIFEKRSQASFYKEWQDKRDKSLYAVLNPTQRQKKSEIDTLQTKMQSMQKDAFSHISLNVLENNKIRIRAEKFQKDQEQLSKQMFPSKDPNQSKNYQKKQENLVKQYQEDILAFYPPSIRDKAREINNINDQYNRLNKSLYDSLSPEQRKKAMDSQQKIHNEEMKALLKQQPQMKAASIQYGKEVQTIIEQQTQELMPSLNPKQQQMLKEIRTLALKAQQEQNASSLGLKRVSAR
jgi:hypothetical protein